MRWGRDGDVCHVHMIDDIGQGGAACWVMDVEVVCVSEAMLDGPADHACANDADLHTPSLVGSVR